MCNRCITTYKIVGPKDAIMDLWNALESINVNTHSIELKCLAKYYKIDYEGEGLNVCGYICKAENNSDASNDCYQLSIDTNSACCGWYELFDAINKEKWDSKMSSTISVEKEQVPIVDLLREYNKNPENQRLKALYNSKTIFDIIGKGRNETAHSSFLNWLLTNETLRSSCYENPLIGLLDCLMSRIAKQYGHCTDSYANIEVISHALLSRTLNISNIQGYVEVPIKDIVIDGKKAEIESDNSGKGDAIDIFITCDVEGIGDIKKFEFVIENKIGTKEGKEKNVNSEVEYDRLTQTQRYYYASNKKDIDDKTYQFFVFLSPASESDIEKHIEAFKTPTDINKMCKSEHFICINYQDIYEDVLCPLLENAQLSNREESIIREYVRVMSVPTRFRKDDAADKKAEKTGVGTSIILAISKEERELLFKYWDNNERLIYSALEAYENEENAIKHDWTRFVDINEKLYTKPECIQFIYDCYSERWNKDEAFKRQEQYAYYIKDFRKLFAVQKNNDTFILKLQTKNEAKPLKIELTKKPTEPLMCAVKKIMGEDFSLDSDNWETQIIEKFCTEAQKLPCYEVFNGRIKRPIKECRDFIDEQGMVISSNSKLDEIFGRCLGMGFLKVKELDYQVDKYQSVLATFWHINKLLIMSSARVMSESERLSSETRKFIRESYTEMSARNNTSYEITWDNNVERGRALAIYKWFAQTLIWNSKTGPKNINNINDNFKTILKAQCNKKDFLSDEQKGDSWRNLDFPMWSTQGSGKSGYYLNIAGYPDSFKKLLEYLSKEGKTEGYTIREI